MRLAIVRCIYYVYHLCLKVPPCLVMPARNVVLLQANGGTSIDGPVMDRFHDAGAGYEYVSLRNQFGAGRSYYHIIITIPYFDYSDLILYRKATRCFCHLFFFS